MRGWHTAVLTEKDVLAISEAIDQGKSNTFLGEEYGVASQTISKIKTGQRWGKLTGRGRDTRRDDL